MSPDNPQPGSTILPTPQPPEPSPPPQQSPGGQYEVVPPITAAPNSGHSGHNPYEFIMAPKTVKKKGFAFGSNSFLARIGLVLGVLAILVVGAAVAISALAPKGSTPGLTTIAERQEEIIRVSNMATDQVVGQDTKNFVTNVNNSVISSQHQVTSYLLKHGVKLEPKVLALDHNSQTDILLKNAASANNYDKAAAQNLTDQLQTYESLLRTTFKDTTNKQSKQLLQAMYDSADRLLAQGKALQQ